MRQSAVSEAIRGGEVLVVAQWEAQHEEADKVADILRRFVPRAQGEPGVKLFLIGRGKLNPAQFLFYELFADNLPLQITGQVITSRRSSRERRYRFWPNPSARSTRSCSNGSNLTWTCPPACLLCGDHQHSNLRMSIR